MVPKTVNGWLILIAVVILGVAVVAFGVILAINELRVVNDPEDGISAAATTTTTEYVVPNITMQQMDPDDIDTMDTEPSIIETRATVTSPTSYEFDGSDTAPTRVVEGGAK